MRGRQRSFPWSDGPRRTLRTTLLLLRPEMVTRAEHMKTIRDGLNHLGFEVVEGAEFYHPVHRLEADPKVARRSRRPSLLPLNRLGAPSKTICSNRSAQASRARHFSLS